MAGLSISQIAKKYGALPVLKNVSLEIGDGEFLTLLGPSGCGKSTLLRIIAGLELQDSGTIGIGDREVDTLRPKERDVAMVFQSYALYPHMTVAQNMGVPLVMRRLNSWQRLPVIGRLLPGTRRTRGEIADKVGTVAAALEIDHLLDRKPAQLSGGQRQRVAVGRAMVRQPRVFLMDEPLSNLDAKLRVQMRSEIVALHRRLGVTFVYVTHDQAEALTMSDRVAVMLGGELLQLAPPQEIYSNPSSRDVAEFIGSPKINMLDGHVTSRGGVEIAGTTIQFDCDLPEQGSVTVGLRPEGFHRADGPFAGTISGPVNLIEHLGADLFVHINIAGRSAPLVVRIGVDDLAHVEVGALLHVRPIVSRALFFSSNGKRIRVRKSGLAGSNVAAFRGHP